MPKGHVNWLVDKKETLITADAKAVKIMEFCYQQDDKVFSEWAKHFRNHYCLDDEIDELRRGTGLSRAQYLNTIKFPDRLTAPGPSIRSGDFAEILVADYLQYILDYWVPRTRYGDKTVRNESTKGSDIIGFKVIKDGEESAKDALAVFETKALFAGNQPANKLQEAVEDSAKDITRKAESLNAIKQKLRAKERIKESLQVERFQDPEGHPYQEVSGAVALYSTACYDAGHVSATDASNHPNRGNLVLIVIHGKDMMKLVHELYERAADEA